MPSQLHESLITLFRNCPALAPALLRDTLQIAVPKFTEARIESAEFTEIQPAAYRADLVVLLSGDEPSLGIVLEVQLSVDEDKEYSWPVYVTSLRARNQCPVCLLVIAAKDDVARWARKPIALGGGNCFTPTVLSLSGVPEITDESQALKDPELAVLSALGHANDPDPDKSARIALMAQMASIGLDEERSGLYCDLVLHSLPTAAREALSAMTAKKYEYQSDFAKHFYELGEAQGRAWRRVDFVLELLTTRYGALHSAVADRLLHLSKLELAAITERVFTTNTLEDALGVRLVTT